MRAVCPSRQTEHGADRSVASGATASGAVCFRASETTRVTYAAGPPGSPIPARAPAARRRGRLSAACVALTRPEARAAPGAMPRRPPRPRPSDASAMPCPPGWRSGIDREHRWRKTRQPERAVESRSRREVGCAWPASGAERSGVMGPRVWGRGAAGGSPHGHLRRTVARRCCRRNAAVPLVQVTQRASPEQTPVAWCSRPHL